METVAQHVEKLYQQLNILQEYIELKFGSDFKDFENFKILHPTKTKVLVTKETEPRLDDHFPSPPNTVTEESGSNLTSDTAWERNIVITNVQGMMGDDGVETNPIAISVPPRSTTLLQVRDDFSQSSAPMATGVVRTTGNASSIRYGGPVTPHRGITSTPYASAGAKRPKKSSTHVIPPCDYCRHGWRSAAHYRQAHREMCVFNVGPDGNETCVGYLCPRANCDREGRLLSNTNTLANHMKGDCKLKRKSSVT